jgi:16S rRNA (guanine1207-N2)-methyltransferase
MDDGRQAEYMHNELQACISAQASGVTVHHTDVIPDGTYALVVLEATAFAPGYAYEAVEQAARVLAPGGMLLTSLPAETPVDKWRRHLESVYRHVQMPATEAYPETIAPAGAKIGQMRQISFPSAREFAEQPCLEPTPPEAKTAWSSRSVPPSPVRISGGQPRPDPTSPAETIARKPRSAPPAHTNEVHPHAEPTPSANTHTGKSAFNDPPLFLASSPHRTPALPTWDEFDVTWGGRNFSFLSGPGVFSPHGLDPGTRALLDSVPAPPPGQRLLDLGCGTGVVAVMTAVVWLSQVVAVDVNARALRLTRLNAERNSVDAAVEIMCSNGPPMVEGDPFALILSNPPYHTDYAVAKVFIERSHRVLRPNGYLWLVVKKPDWYQEKLRAVFGGYRSWTRDGYTILAAQRREQTVSRSQQKTTTRKHRRRMEDAAKRKRRKLAK